jgi:hypothetical protein
MVAVLEDETIPVFWVFILEIMKTLLRAVRPIQPLIHSRPEFAFNRASKRVKNRPSIKLTMSFQKAYAPSSSRKVKVGSIHSHN